MFRITIDNDEAMPPLYSIVQDKHIAGGLLHQEAVTLVTLLNQQAESKTPTPSDLEKQAPITG